MRRPSSATSSTCSRPKGSARRSRPPQAQVGRGLAPEDRVKAPCQEVFFEGADVDLGAPDPALLAGRSGAVHHASAVITKDPRTGARNVGMYRMQVIDRSSTFMHWQMHKDGRADLLAADGRRIPVAVAIGLDPVTATRPARRSRSTSTSHARRFLRGEPVELVKCKTVDLEVPAHAEIVLEGHVSKDDIGIEGPFGDHRATTPTPSRSRSSGSPR